MNSASQIKYFVISAMIAIASVGCANAETKDVVENSCDGGAKNALASEYDKALSKWGSLSDDKAPKERLRFVLICLKKSGIAKSDEGSTNWIKQAASSDSAIAQLYLGMLYASGVGIVQDVSKAKEWLHRSEQNGNKQAAQLITLLEQTKMK